MKIMKMKTKHILFSLIFTCIIFSLNAQENADVYWVTFKDKANNTYSLSNPEAFLTQKSIERRNKQGIAINESDLPVSDYYINSLTDLGITVRYTSKWFNGAAVQSSDSLLLDTLENYDFITEKILIREKVNQQKTSPVIPERNDVFNYGLGENQIVMLNGNILHNQGYSGQGMLIAVLDSGFPNVNTLPCFTEMNNENRIVATRNIVSGTDDVFGYHSHGRSVLSILAGKESGKLIGAAPDANFILIRTEDVGSEQLIEEYNWIAGAEYADSLGVDVMSVSLGYREYDNPIWSHAYSDCNGKTAPMSKAATMAARKGILVVVAAGNDGLKENPHIAVPADADSILTVGAVDYLGNYAGFSSIGYSSDGRVKPDVVAQGQATYFQISDSSIVAGNGTSFATPIISGLAACLWQANPNMTNMEILHAIQESASMYDNPNEYMGYGIPNFAIANLALQDINYTLFDTENLVNVYPNPVADVLNVEFYSVDTQKINIEIYNALGKIMYQAETNIRRNTYKKWKITDIANYTKGLYILQITTKHKKHSQKFIKE